MDLTTTFLGLELHSPLVVSASPLSEEIDNIKKMEEAGASAVVLYSLFEEQLKIEQRELHHHLTEGTESYPEAITYFPEPDEFHVGPDGYLNHIRAAKEAVDIPVIASLNGSTIGGWTSFAKQMEDAGADALELNLYHIPADIHLTGSQVEETYLEVIREVRKTIAIPMTVKLSPFFSNLANMAKRISEAGANGLTLFNRFYQPDIDLEELEVKPNVLLSTPQALRLPLRWIAILYGRVQADFAATSGVHQVADVLKLLMVGANCTMMASALFRHGIDHVKTLEAGLTQWMEEHEYESVRQMQGSMSQQAIDDPSSFERAQYMKAVSTMPPAYYRQ
jgi:dihydroorotate dehydrogenase (fumarate)